MMGHGTTCKAEKQSMENQRLESTSQAGKRFWQNKTISRLSLNKNQK